MNKHLWKASFAEDGVPTLPCPTCKHSSLTAVRDSLEIRQSAHSKRIMADDFAGPEDLVERFRLTMKCSVSSCGELVELAGYTSHHEIEVDDEHTYGRMLHPKSIYPAPPIISVPPETPSAIAEELQNAFQFFWTHLETSAGRLRACVERLMDDMKIPKTNGQTGTQRRYLTLAKRIDRFAVNHPEHEDSFDALRQIGNLGTHSTVTQPSLLAGFEIFEHVLAEIYGKRTKKNKPSLKTNHKR